MNASDLARFGHLVATRGNWKGEQLIDPQWLRGHSGGNGSGVSGESRHYTALASVATRGIEHPFAVARESFLPAELFVGPVKAAAA
jgi:CubicO group peptidase (beta-lactamase class C family)